MIFSSAIDHPASCSTKYPYVPPQAAEAKAIAAILLKSGWFPRFSDDSVQADIARIETTLALSCTGSDCRSLYVAEAGGNVVACLTAQWLPCLFLPAKEGYVSELFVDDERRGRGIGKRLMLCNARHRDS